MQEKNIIGNIIYFNPSEPPKKVLDINPKGTSPTLFERDLVLYDSRIIMEYLDERFPHPSLHKTDPISRANVRMIIKDIDQDWYKLLDDSINSTKKKSTLAKKTLKESLISSTPIFQSNTYFMNEEFSLIDCVMAPLLWRLPSIGIDIKTLNTSIISYANNLFSRSTFQRSLSEEEKKMMLHKK